MEKNNYCNTCPTGLRGVCCWHSYFDGTTNWAIEPCPYLNKAGRCKIYKNRFIINKRCLTVDKALTEGALPKECPYVKESVIIPVRPNKILKKEMIKYGVQKRRFQAIT